MRATPLFRKLLRDVVRLRTQGLAVALVMACGVAMLVMGLGMRESLRQSRDRYYDNNLFAHVQANATRAPLRLQEEIGALPGVQAAELRVASLALLDLPGAVEPLAARVVSLPTQRQVQVNRPVLVSGRWPERQDSREVLVNEAFATARQLGPGSTLDMTLRGQRIRAEVVGVANSPEFVFISAPGEIFPQPDRFGVVWMPEKSLRKAAGLDGAFNEAVLRFGPGVDERAAQEVRRRVDELLAPYGGQGAVGRDRILSARFLEDELGQLSTMASTLPPIFLLVGAFLLNVSLSRNVMAERTNIGLLKAFGYGDRAIGFHYLSGALILAAVGVLLGIGLGTIFGEWMSSVYRVFYRLPSLPFEVEGWIVGAAAGVGLLAGLAGAWSAVRQAVRLPPAAALAPPAPPSFQAAQGGLRHFLARLDPLSRIIVRRLTGYPRRSLSTLLGIALALAVLIVSQHFPAAIERFLQVNFIDAKRHQATLSFVEARGPAAVHALAHLPGVEAVEPFQGWEVRLRHGSQEVQESIIGVPADARLDRLLEDGERPIHVRADGVTLSSGLAKRLHAQPGDRVQITATSGRRRTVEATVVAIATLWVGSSAYMEIEALGRLLGESERYHGANLRYDPQQHAALNAALRKTPGVLGVSYTAQVESAMRKTFEQSSGFMATLFLLFAGLMAAGVAFATARVTFAEQQRDLATLQVLGFSRAEASYVLLGELAVLSVLAILPGLAVGYGFALWLMSSFSNDLLTMPMVVDTAAYARSTVFILAAVAASTLIVRREVDAIDLVASLKFRE